MFREDKAKDQTLQKNHAVITFSSASIMQF